MRSPLKNSIQNSTNKYNYLVFDSVMRFNSFVDTEAANLSESNQSRWETIKRATRDNLKKDSDWYGTPTPKNIEALEAHRTFMGMSLIKEIQPKIKDRLAHYIELLQDNVLPKPKMAYNDRGLGVFSFDKAAMAMYKHYSINSITPLDTSVSQMNIELDKYAVQTSVKNVYAYFKNKEQSYPSLQLYIMSGANAHVKGNELFYVGLACAELVEFMELRGISVEVNILLGTSFDNQVVVSQIRLKRFQDILDKNQLLLMSSDPRYFRYRGFKSLIVMANCFGLTIPLGLGSIQQSMGADFVKEINPDGFVFEQSYSIDKAVKEVTQIIENYKQQLNTK